MKSGDEGGNAMGQYRYGVGTESHHYEINNITEIPKLWVKHLYIHDPTYFGRLNYERRILNGLLASQNKR